MRCYIWGTNNRDIRTEDGKGVACFAIPDWGLQFRAAQDGNAAAAEYAALLALLRFVASNPRVFEGQNLEIFTDASQFVEQVNGRLPVDPLQLKPHLLVRSLREKIRFELAWVPPDQNRAIDGILDLPPLKKKIEVETGPARPKTPLHPRRSS